MIFVSELFLRAERMLCENPVTEVQHDGLITGLKDRHYTIHLR